MERGSDKILAAWKTRLDDDKVAEIASYFDSSAATIDAVVAHGGAQPSGLSVSMRYADDDIPRCGNDLSFWLEFIRKHGGVVHEWPRIIINGTPWPDLITVTLPFGDTGPGPVDVPDLGGLATRGGFR